MKEAMERPLIFHGFRVDAKDYGKVRHLATLLYGEIDVKVPDAEAWTMATGHAIDVLRMWRVRLDGRKGQGR